MSQLVDSLERSSVIVIRPELSAFSSRMELVLRRNDHKGGWKDSSAEYLLSRLVEETGELCAEAETLIPSEQDRLRFAVHHLGIARSLLAGARLRLKDGTKVSDEACDVANIAMMISDNWGGK